MLTMFRCCLLLVCGVAVTLAASTGHGDTATLKGKFVLDGAAPKPEAITPTKDAEVCGKHKLERETLVVGADGGIQNVLIWAPKVKAPAEAKGEGPAVMDNKDCRFQPHILAMQAGQVLELKNSDPVGHNTEGHPRNNPEFNILIPASGKIEIKDLKKAETRPFEVKCAIHPWMKGYVLVSDAPSAVSNADGSFEIKGLPAGTQVEFQVWQERGGFVKDVTVDGKKTTWGFGRFKMTLKPGENDMGTIKAKIGGGT
jgi:plastocyanin